MVFDNYYQRCPLQTLFSNTFPNASKWLGCVSECNAIIILHRAVWIWRHTFKQRFHWGKRGHIIGRQLLLVLENVPSSSVVIAVSQARWWKLWMRSVRRCLPLRGRASARVRWKKTLKSIWETFQGAPRRARPGQQRHWPPWHPCKSRLVCQNNSSVIVCYV